MTIGLIMKAHRSSPISLSLPDQRCTGSRTASAYALCKGCGRRSHLRCCARDGKSLSCSNHPRSYIELWTCHGPPSNQQSHKIHGLRSYICTGSATLRGWRSCTSTLCGNVAVFFLWPCFRLPQWSRRPEAYRPLSFYNAKLTLRIWWNNTAD